jgi:hypothetical protein
MKTALEQPRRLRKIDLKLLYDPLEDTFLELNDWRTLLFNTIYKPAQAQHFIDWFFMNFNYSPEYDMILEEAVQMRHELQKLGISLKLFELKYHKYPDQLNDLIPEFESTIPLDLFAEAPLKYSKVDKGFVLYSVGANEQDDAGKSSEDNPRGDDIVVRLP